MIFKVLYQESTTQVPRRENTQSIYIEAESRVEAIDKVTKNTPYNIEYVQELDEAHLEYERENNPDFEVVDF